MKRRVGILYKQVTLSNSLTEGQVIFFEIFSVHPVYWYIFVVLLSWPLTLYLLSAFIPFSVVIDHVRVVVVFSTYLNFIKMFQACRECGMLSHIVPALKSSRHKSNLWMQYHLNITLNIVLYSCWVHWGNHTSLHKIILNVQYLYNVFLATESSKCKIMRRGRL